MFKIVEILIFVIFVQQMHFWPLENLPVRYVSYLACLLLLACPLYYKRHMYGNFNPMVMVLAGAWALDTIWSSGFTAVIVASSFMFIGLSVLMMRPEPKAMLLRDITNWYAWMCIICLVYFLIGQVVQLPMLGQLIKPFGYDWTYDNYGLYLVLLGTTDMIPRFSGPFLEPGHLAIAAVFLLYANKFAVKKKPVLWGLIAAVLASMSLAGYVLLFIALVLQMRIRWQYIVMLAAVVGLPYLFVTQIWEGGNNPVNTIVLSRLEYDKQTGIKGNNRFTGNTDLYFKKWTLDGSLIKGIGVEEYTKYKEKGILAGAGYKIYIIQYGYLGALIILGLYAAMTQYASNKRLAWTYFILILLTFLQRTYPLWMSWIIPYACTMTAWFPTRIMSIRDYFLLKKDGMNPQTSTPPAPHPAPATQNLL